MRYNMDKKEYMKKYREENSEKLKKQEKGYREKNKDKKKKYNIENKEALTTYNREYSKEYYQNNKEKIKKKNDIYEKTRMKIDPIYKFKKVIRRTIYRSFKRKNYKKSLHTEEILGCTLNEFKEYISFQFKEGMTLKNHGLWHLDHIKPLAIAKSKEEVVKLCHYSNFQPLWAEENLEKSAK